MKSTLTACALLLALSTGAAFAGQAEICYTTPVASGASQPPNNATVFNCPTIGALTLPQIAAQGWQVVQLVPVVWSSSDPLNILVTDQLLVQKP